MMFGTAACDGNEKKKDDTPAKAEAKDGKAKDGKAKDGKAKDGKAEDPEIAIGKDGKAAPLGVPGM